MLSQESSCADRPNHGQQSHDLVLPSLIKTPSALTGIVRLDCPVQALDAEEVDSTSNTSTPEALVDIGRAPSATPQRREYTTVCS